MNQQLEQLVASYLKALDRYDMPKVYALRGQMRQLLASVPIGQTDSLRKCEPTPATAASVAPTSTTRLKREPTLRLKSIVD
jgi:hypothetical protein